MERKTKVKLDPLKLATIDAIYISHSHTDHLDPYTLIEIYSAYSSEQDFSPVRNDKNKGPTLLIPFTLEYLAPLFREYLGDIDIRIL